MACLGNCNGRLANRYIISQSVTFTGGNLVINLPNRAYNNGQIFCLVIAQSIPAETTINAPVVFTIGTGTVQFPFNTKCCIGITASQVKTRTLYPVRVNTDITTSTGTGAFIYVGNRCLPQTDVVSVEVIDEDTTAAE